MNLFQRVAAPTPAEEKRVQVICLILECVVAYLINFHIGPQLIMVAIAGILAGIAALAQYAVKDVAIVGNAITDPSTIFSAISELSSQFTEVKGLVTSNTVPDPNVIVKQIIAGLAPPVQTRVVAALAPAEGAIKLDQPITPENAPETIVT